MGWPPVLAEIVVARLTVGCAGFQLTEHSDFGLPGARVAVLSAPSRGGVAALAFLSVFHRKSFSYGAFVWAWRPLNRPFGLFRARAEARIWIGARRQRKPSPRVRRLPLPQRTTRPRARLTGGLSGLTA
jgi:hypothetical protein